MKNIIFISPVDFNGLKQRHQGLAIEFAKKGFNIFFVNPIKSNGLSCKVTNSEAELKFVDIKVPFKAVSYPLVQCFAVKIAYRLLKKKLHIDLKDSILWLAEPSLADLVKYDWKKIIYDCCDLHGLFPKQKLKVWKYYEALIAKKADLITFSHEYIKERFIENINNTKLFKKRLNNEHKWIATPFSKAINEIFKSEDNKSILPKMIILPNATFFNSINRNKHPITTKVKMLSSGAHFEWVDMDWLQMLANLDNVELHIAGKGRGTSFKKLINSKNVVFHGELDSDNLLKLMEECHVGLVPFKDIELIKGVDPIKVYDYAALGLDIWAPDLKQLYSNKYINCFIKNCESAKTEIESLLSPLQLNKKIVVVDDLYNIHRWSERIEVVLPYL
jgi:glycosyltransferase involved in cell wall biosynthesis